MHLLTYRMKARQMVEGFVGKMMFNWKPCPSQRGEAFWKKTMPSVSCLLSCLPVHSGVSAVYASGAAEHKQAWCLQLLVSRGCTETVVVRCLCFCRRSVSVWNDCSLNCRSRSACTSLEGTGRLGGKNDFPLTRRFFRGALPLGPNSTLFMSCLTQTSPGTAP